MKTIGTNAVLFLSFLVLEGVLARVRLRNLGIEIPWMYILMSWTSLTVIAWLLHAGLQQLTHKQAAHWAMFALAIVAGCTAGEAYLPPPHGAWLGALMCVVMVGLTASLNPWILCAPLVALWVLATPRGQSLEPYEPTKAHPDIIVLTIDTVREDAISHSPNRLVPGLTPNMDARAVEGCWTEDASATSPLTGPSHAAMFSGVHPLELGLFRNGGALPSDIPWLPEELHRLGYQTGAFVSSAMIEGDLGYRRGFTVYDDDQSGLAARLNTSLAPLLPAPRISKHDAFSRFGLKTVERMNNWLERTDPNRPVFLWLHLYDAHQPYVATAESQEFVANFDLKLPDPQSFSQWVEPRVAKKEPTIAQTIFSDLTPETLPQLEELSAIGMSKRYLASVRDLDGIVGTAWKEINRHRATQQRVWAIIGDHGESLTEHGEYGSHQHNVYEANIRVPYILSGDDCPRGPVSTASLPAELVKRARIPIPWPVHEAVEAVVSAGEKAPSHPSTIKASKRIGNRKWVTGFRDGQTIFREAYDLTVDRHEQHPIDEQNGKMSEFVDNIQSRIGEAPQTKTEDESVNEALRALGYIE